MSKKDRQKEGKKELMEGEGLKGLEKKTTEASIITLVLAGLVVSQDERLNHGFDVTFLGGLQFLCSFALFFSFLKYFCSLLLCSFTLCSFVPTL